MPGGYRFTKKTRQIGETELPFRLLQNASRFSRKFAEGLSGRRIDVLGKRSRDDLTHEQKARRAGPIPTGGKTKHFGIEHLTESLSADRHSVCLK
jgi:hypothetical protein